ncbi:MAG: carbohydrate ABC transporter permease [Clostridia bacterium]|jgi:putative aldouronate transport system permease protein|nr:carbohydrate ABC transporter permease [Clostridia bacterium]
MQTNVKKTDPAKIKHRTIRSKKEKAFNVCNIVILSLLGVCFVLPYLFILSASLMSEGEYLARGYSLIPYGFTFDAYVQLFKYDTTILKSLGCSIFLTVTGTLLHTCVNVLAAYPLSKPNFVGKNLLMKILIFAMLFSGGLIPTYILIVNMGLKNNWLALLLPGALAPWTCIMIRSFFLSVPPSLEEAMKMDGANNLTVLLHVYVPMSVPVIASQMMFMAVGFWSSWSGPLLYFDHNHRDMLPLAAVLQQMLQKNVNPSGGSVGGDYSETMKMAMVVISTLPVIAAYPFMQKYFISGMMLGSVKE